MDRPLPVAAGLGVSRLLEGRLLQRSGDATISAVIVA